MNKWIDVQSSLPPSNTVVLGMATTVDFANKALPCIVGFDPSRGWITWPNQELCFVFHWELITTPEGKTIKMFEVSNEDTILDHPCDGDG